MGHVSGTEPGFIYFSAPVSVIFPVEIGILERKCFFKKKKPNYFIYFFTIYKINQSLGGL